MSEPPLEGVRLAFTEGRVVGVEAYGRRYVWLLDQTWRLIPTTWPSGFKATVDPVELVDSDGHSVARGGDYVRVTGGFEPARGDLIEVLGAESHPKVFRVQIGPEKV